MKPRHLRYLLNATATEGGAAGTGANPDLDAYKSLGSPDEIKKALADLNKVKAEQERQRKAAETGDFANQLKARNEDATGFARDLHRELQEAREQLAAANARVPEGGAVLTPAQAKAWEAYSKFGKPDDLAKVLESGKEAAAKAAQLERSQQLRDVAEVAGFTPSVLNRLAGDLAFEVKEEAVLGKPKKVAYVVPKEGEEGQPVKLDDYAKQHWGDFLPSLKPAGQAQQRPFGSPSGGVTSHAPMGGQVQASGTPRPVRSGL